jgi:hypothetical protein
VPTLSTFYSRLLSIGCLGLLVASQVAVPALVHAQAPPAKLAYRWEPGREVAYEIVITADEAESIDELKGVVYYQPTAVEEGVAKLSFRGGLSKFTRAKPEARPRGIRPPFGPRGFGAPFDPFNRSPFTGLGHTTNEIAITPQGEVQSLKGSSQLPHLLGNLSLLVFESLPAEPRAEWTVKNGVSISQGGGRQSGPPFFRPSPFDRPTEESSTAGSESTDYKVVESAEGKVVVSKTYKLTSPPDADGESHEITGSGKWTFNTTLGVPETFDYKQDITTKTGNVTVTVPVTIKYRRLTDDELTKLKEEAERRLAEAKAQAEEEKAKAEAPLEPAQKQAILADLAGGDQAKQREALVLLEKKSPQQTDSEIVAAIKPLLTADNRSLANLAERALSKWSPEFKKSNDLNKAYQGPAFVQASNLPVAADTTLFVGQILIGHDTGAWYPAEIVALHADGTVDVTFRGWGNRKSTLPRSRLQLAPPEVLQPNLKTEQVAAAGKPAPATENPFATPDEKASRTWTDVSGRFTIEGKYLGKTGDSVRLLRADGKELTVPLAKLSAADQKFVAARETPEPENPFAAP